MISDNFSKSSVRVFQFLLITFLLLTTYSFAQSETRVFQEWAKTKGEQNMYHHTRSVTDANKNVYLVGSTFNVNGNYDMMVVKYNRKGDELWDDIIQGSAGADDHGADLVIDNQGNLIVTGAVINTGSAHDMVLRKYNSDGTVIWTQYYDGPAGLMDGGTSLCIGGENDIYVGGATFGASTLSDYLVLKYSGNGIPQWSRIYDYVGLHDVVTKIAYKAGTVFVTGASEAVPGKWEMCTIKVDALNGEPGPAHRTGGSSEDIDRVTDIIVDASDNIYVIGAVKNVSSDFDMKIVKLDSDLNVLWDVEIDGIDGLEDQANGIQVDAMSNVYVTGYVTTATHQKDYYTCKINSSGNIVWSTTFDGADHGEDFGVALVLDGTNLFVTGSSFHITNQDYYTLKYTTAGVQMWEKGFNSEANMDDRAIGITLDEDGNLLVIGQVDYFDGKKRYYTVKYSEKEIVLPLMMSRYLAVLTS